MDYKKKDKHHRSGDKHHSSSSWDSDRKKLAAKLEEHTDYSTSEKRSSHASTSKNSKERSPSPVSPKRRHGRSPSPTSHKKKKRRSRSRSPPNKHSRSYESAGFSKHFAGDRSSGRRAREARYDMIQQSLKQQEEQAKLGISAPNPNFPNQVSSTNNTATKLVEEIEKRKSLFSKKAQEPTGSVWNSTSLTNDSDGTMTAKFKRLMGIKGADAPAAASVAEKPEGVNRNQAEYLANLEKQYEVARAITHTQRGVGLGFGGAGISNNRP